MGVRLRKTAARMPVVLDRAEVGELFKQLEGDWRLMAQVMYGSGLRLAWRTRKRRTHQPRSAAKCRLNPYSPTGNDHNITMQHLPEI